MDKAVDRLWNRIPERYKTFVACMVLLGSLVFGFIHKNYGDGNSIISPIINESNVAIGNEGPVNQTLNLYKSEIGFIYLPNFLNEKGSGNIFHSNFSLIISNIPPNKGGDIFWAESLECSLKQIMKSSILGTTSVSYEAECSSNNKVIDDGKLFWYIGE